MPLEYVERIAIRCQTPRESTCIGWLYKEDICPIGENGNSHCYTPFQSNESKFFLFFYSK